MLDSRKRRKRALKLNNAGIWLRNHYMILVVIVFLIVGSYLTVHIIKNRDSGEDMDMRDIYLLVEADNIKLTMYQPVSFDALASTDEDVYYLDQIIYSSLFRLDDGLNIVPDVVQNYETDADSGIVYIDLRKDVFFPDGSKLTMDDVIKSIDSIRAIGEGGPYFRYVSRIAKCEAYGDFSCVITFTSPREAALDNLVFPLICAADYSPGAEMTQGSGAYSFGAYKAGSSLVLEPNPYYHGGVAAYPVNITMTKDKSKIPGLMTMDAVTAFLSKESNADAIATDRSLSSRLIPSGELEFIGFNMEKEDTGNKAIRQVLAAAIDRKQLIADDYAGMALVSDSLYFPGFLGADKDVGLNYDPKRAVDSMAAIGYSDVDEDGVVEREDGNDFILTMIVADGYQSRVDAAENIAEQLADIGIHLDVQVLPQEDFEAKRAEGDFDLLFAGIRMDKQFRMRELFDNDNPIHYENESVQDLVDELERAHTDSELRSLFAELKAALNDDMPYFPVCYKAYCFMSVSTFSSASEPLYFDPYRDIAAWRWQKRVNVAGGQSQWQLPPETQEEETEDE